MKKSRHEKILELISNFEIDTQDELIDQLAHNGYTVTQATISRDIRELKISKVLTSHGTYRYILPPQNEAATGFRFNSALVESITHVDYAQNIVVIKTYPGMSQAVAVGIDNMDMVQILGCVAGDDTIMIVAHDTDCAAEITDKLKELMHRI